MGGSPYSFDPAPGDPRSLLEEWYVRVVTTQRAHYLSAEHFGARRYWLGVPAVILSTLVGTSVFATVQKQPDVRFQIAVGLASVLAAVLTSLQTLLGYSERAEKHRITGARYGAIGRELESLRAFSSSVTEQAMAAVRKRLDDLALESPNNPESIFAKAALVPRSPPRAESPQQR